jgi:hypothetical protein
MEELHMDNIQLLDSAKVYQSLGVSNFQAPAAVTPKTAEATFNPELAKTLKLNPYLFQQPAVTDSLASFDTAGLDAKFKEAQGLLQSTNPSDQIKGTQKMMEFERLFSLIIKMLEAAQRAIMKAIDAIPTR